MSGRTRAESSNRYRYVKRRPTKSGARWQARAWMPYPIGNLYLGSFNTEREAWNCVIQWVRRGADPVRDLPEGCLPKWVYRCQGGFMVKIRQKKTRVLLGPFPTAETAFLAALHCWEYRGWAAVGGSSPFRLVDPQRSNRRHDSLEAREPRSPFEKVSL